MKKCFKCKKVKEIHFFYKHIEMRDGHLNKCKECTKNDVRLDRLNNPNARLYDIKRWKTNPERRRKAKEVSKKWRKNNPLAYKAHYIVSNAIRSGILKREGCEICGKKAHAHHRDYKKPLDVQWLCPLHHHRLHHKKAKK